MSGISVLHRHVEWVVVYLLGPLYDSVLTEEDGGCGVVMLSACICLSLLCMFFFWDLLRSPIIQGEIRVTRCCR